jgi:hypothetical protein
MNSSKKARYSASLINQNQGGGPKKEGKMTSTGHPANVLWRLYRNSGAPGYNPTINYGSTVKGRVGAVAPFY